jgi:hypothetical protein
VIVSDQEGVHLVALQSEHKRLVNRTLWSMFVRYARRISSRVDVSHTKSEMS